MSSSKTSTVVFVITAVIICIFWGCSHDSQVKHEKEMQKFSDRVWNGYNTGLAYLQKDYINYDIADKACLALSNFSPWYTTELKKDEEHEKLKILNDEKYKDALYLYFYASAIKNSDDLKLDKQRAYDYALSELDKIPSSYDGELADDINNFRNKIRKEKAENQRMRDGIEKAIEQRRASTISIGDPDIKVVQIYGEPQRKNKTTTAHGTREQWVYPNGTYIYIQDGRVTSWQTSE